MDCHPLPSISKFLVTASLPSEAPVSLLKTGVPRLRRVIGGEGNQTPGQSQGMFLLHQLAGRHEVVWSCQGASWAPAQLPSTKSRL